MTPTRRTPLLVSAALAAALLATGCVSSSSEEETPGTWRASPARRAAT
ncbi:hypothetical protein RB200_23765 [Streptomyces sp. PmtG]